MPVVAGLPVLPGLFGYGTLTQAAYGGGVPPIFVRVTSLADSGTGTLRAALEGFGLAPRIVIFEISGVIFLQTDISLSSPFMIIAFCTAPYPGIVITGGAIHNHSHDILKWHERTRPGDVFRSGDPLPQTADHDSCETYGQDGNELVYNNVMCHCSYMWAGGKVASVFNVGTNSGTTFWECMFAEALFYASNIVVSPGQPSSLGLVYKNFFVSVNANVSVIRPLFACSADRNPEVQGWINTEIINPVVYGWGYDTTAYPWGLFIYQDVFDPLLDGSGNPIPGTGHGPRVDLRSPVFIGGPNFDPYTANNAMPFPPLYCIGSYGYNNGTQLYYDDVLIDASQQNVQLYQNFMADDPRVASPTQVQTGRIIMPSSATKAYVLDHAGAWSGFRDPVETRIVNNVKNYTGRVITSPSDVGGQPAMVVNVRALTTPANPHADSGNGYSNAEVWMQAFATSIEAGGSGGGGGGGTIGGGFADVQVVPTPSRTGQAAGTTALSSTPQTNVMGDTVVVFARWDSSSGAFLGIANTGAYTWIDVLSPSTATDHDGASMRAWYAKNVPGTVNDVVTLTFAAPGAVFAPLVVVRVRNADIDPLLDADFELGTGALISSAALYSGPTGNPALLVGFFVADGAGMSATGGDTVTPFSLTGNATQYFADASQVVTGNSMLQATCGNDTWALMAVSLKAGPGGGVAVVETSRVIDTAIARINPERATPTEAVKIAETLIAAIPKSTTLHDSDATGAAAAGVQTYSFNHTQGAGLGRCVIVAIGTGTSLKPITSLTYAGLPMTTITDIVGSHNTASIRLAYLVDPPVGVNAVVAQSADNERWFGAATSFFSVDRATPVELTDGGTSGSGANPAVTLTPLTTEAWLVNGIYWGKSTNPSAQNWVGAARATDVATDQAIGLAYRPNAPLSPQTDTWTASAPTPQDWVSVAISLKPAPYLQLVTEAAKIADSVVAARGLTATLGELVHASEAVVSLPTLAAAPTEALRLREVLIAAVDAGQAIITEAGKLGDAALAVLQMAVTAGQDALRLAEVLAVGLDLSAAPGEALHAAESLSPLPVLDPLSTGPTETAKLAETIAASGDLATAPTEALRLAESPIATFPVRLADEGLRLAEQVTVALIPALSEVLRAAETLTAFVDPEIASASEGLRLADAVQVVGDLASQLADQVGRLADTDLQVALDLSIAVPFERPRLADTVTPMRDLEAAPAEAAKISEAVTAGRDLTVIVGLESLKIAEAAPVRQLDPLLGAAAEALRIAESIVFPAGLDHLDTNVPPEGVRGSESIAAGKTPLDNPALGEAIRMGDAITGIQLTGAQQIPSDVLRVADQVLASVSVPHYRVRLTNGTVSLATVANVRVRILG